MRALPLAVGVSAGIHAALVAWLAIHASGPRRADQAPATTPIEIVTVDRPPEPPAATAAIDLQLPALPLSRVAPPPAELPRVEPPRVEPPGKRGAELPPRGATSASTTGPAGPAEQPAAPADHQPGRSSLLTMRHGEAPRAVLPVGRWDDLDHPPAGTAPARDRTTGLLHESGGGTYRSDPGVFDAAVRADGAVALTDRPNLDVHLALPTPKSLGRALAGWYESDKGAYGAEGDQAMGRQIQMSAGATATVKDPVTHETPDHTTTVIVPVLGGGFDVTDWLMRNHKQDPYSRRKLAFLDATRDERVQIGERSRGERLALTPQIVHRSLEAIWAATADAAQRKQAVFELWDDCVETGDPAAVEAGAAARRMIIGFIRARLPAGSRDAFTAGELAAVARAKRSTAAFQPYE